jgi:hypothetical protein
MDAHLLVQERDGGDFVAVVQVDNQNFFHGLLSPLLRLAQCVDHGLRSSFHVMVLIPGYSNF